MSKDSGLFDGKIEEKVILDFATEWFLMHISSHDKRLGSYMALQAVPA